MQISFPKHPDLAEEVSAYLAASEMRPTTFGKKSVGDPSLIRGLTEGRELRQATLSRIRRFIATGRAKEAAR